MNNIFELMKKYNCEEIHFKYDTKTGMRAIITINSTRRGAMCSGGVRMRDYENEDAALWDSFNLSQAMTYKCAAINANVGGGKAVIWNSIEEKTPELLKVFATFVNSFNGRFRTAVDLGLDHEDGEIIKSICPFVEGQPEKYGGFGTEGDVTALGVLKAMRIGVKYKLNKDSLNGLTVAVQGIGNVGYYLVDFLYKEGASIIISDINTQVLENIKKEYPKVNIVSPEQILFQKCDILAPCAIGGVLDENTIPKLNCKIVCGSANNQFLTPHVGIKMLEKLNILFLPDFVVNAGGIIQAIVEINKGTKEQAFKNTYIIEENINYILDKYKNSSKSTLDIAYELAEVRLSETVK